MLKHIIAAVLVVGCVLPSSPAFAQVSTRCTVDDVLRVASFAQGRNAWARKCGYISSLKEAFLNQEGEYQIFLSACSAFPYYPTTSSCQAFAPVSVYDPCVTGFYLLGTCSIY